MIALNGEKYYDYEETARLMHCKYTHVRDLVSKKKLNSRYIGVGKKKYIALTDIKQRINAINKDTSLLDNETATLQQNKPTNVSTALVETSNSMPFPIHSQSLQAIEMVNAGYGNLTQSLERSLEPLIRTVKDTDTEAFIKLMSEFIQAIMNRLYSLPPDKPIRSFTPMEFMLYIFQDVNIPDSIKLELLQASMKVAENAYENETQNKSA